METLKISNWDRWQSYRRDRGQPPWIKVHRCVMRNPEWVGLSDAQRGQLVAIWLLAADHDGVIPASAKVVQKLCYLDSEPDFKFFMEQGFIEHDANVTPPRRQRDETETETETEKDYICPFEDFYSVYPRKEAKAKAEKSWKRMCAKDRLAAVHGVKSFQFSPDRQFQPLPASWLNQRRWEDEPHKGNGQADDMDGLL